ncbi:MAG: hypothetical protein HON51_07670 [Gammaproteobacteria bacterium]|jgi:hypothetical protein|nr:hypothetical protein [Gammaproteobacteria bacterium]MBT6576087.1 hypothetical protein [Gammaproteobacteria bacterium]
MLLSNPLLIFFQAIPLGGCPRIETLLRKNPFWPFFPNIFVKERNYSPQMFEKTDSKRLSLATASILGQSPSQFSGPWCYRAYQSGLLAGITSGDSNFPPGVYVMGGRFGNTPAFIGSVREVFTLLGLPTTPGGGSGQEAICDNSNNETSGIVQTHDGNKIIITTKGCIKPPKYNRLCDITGGLVETGIYALGTIRCDNFKFSGDIPVFPITPGIPPIANPLDAIVDSFSSKICTIHTPEKILLLDVVMDLCLDMTDQVGILPGGTPPVTLELKGLSTLK